MNTRLFNKCIFPTVLSVLLISSARADGVAFNIGDIFAGTGSGTILHYSPTFTLLDTLDPGFGGEQTGMAFDSDLNLLATNFGGSVITKFSSGGNIVMPNPFVTDDPGSHNESIVFNKAGEFFIGQADGTADVIKRAADGTFIARYDVASAGRGSDWVELASDQKTIFYTGEGTVVKRFDTSTNTQLPDFATLPGSNAFALRFLPTGDLLVADGDRVVRLNSTGTVVKTYFPPGAVEIFALNLEPNGTTFLTADISTGIIYRFDIATGALLTTFDTGTGEVAGLAVAGEVTAGAGGGNMEDGFLGLAMAIAQREILLNIDRVATRDVNARLFRLRAGANETTEAVTPLRPSDGKEIMRTDSSGKTMISGKDYKESGAAEETLQRFTFFADGDFGRADQDHIDTHPGFEGDTWAGTLGAEVRLTREFTLGFGGTYLENDTTLNDDLGSVDITGFAISAYASWVHKHFYVDLLYSFGSYDDEIHRNTLTGETVRADPQSDNHTVAFNIGYNFHYGNWVTGPIGSLNYINGQLGSYSETGSSTAGVHVGEQHFDSLVSNLGWQASYRIRTGFGAITPQIRASWERENLDENDLVTAQLLNAPVSFMTRAPAPGDDYVALGGGFLVDVGDRYSFVADVEDHLARSHRNDLFASVRVAVKF